MGTGTRLHADCKPPSSADPKVWKPRELPEDEVSALNQRLASDPECSLPAGVFRQHLLVRDTSDANEAEEGPASASVEVAYDILDHIMVRAIGVPLFPQKMLVRVRTNFDVSGQREALPSVGRSKHFLKAKGSKNPIREKARTRFHEDVPLSGT